MSNQNWLEILGWGNEEINDLRFVGYSYVKQGFYDIAITFFDALVVLNKGNPYDLQTLGALHLQIGNGPKALEFLDRAIELDPTHLPSQINRARAFFMLGYKRQGLAAAMKLEKNPDHAIASQASALILAYH